MQQTGTRSREGARGWAPSNGPRRDWGSRSWRCCGTVTHLPLSPAAAPSNVLSCCRWSLGPAGAMLRARGKGGRGWGSLHGRRQQRRGVLDDSSRGRGRGLNTRVWHGNCERQHQRGSRYAGGCRGAATRDECAYPLLTHAATHAPPPPVPPLARLLVEAKASCSCMRACHRGGARRVVGFDLARRMVKASPVLVVADGHELPRTPTTDWGAQEEGGTHG